MIFLSLISLGLAIAAIIISFITLQEMRKNADADIEAARLKIKRTTEVIDVAEKEIANLTKNLKERAATLGDFDTVKARYARDWNDFSNVFSFLERKSYTEYTVVCPFCKQKNRLRTSDMAGAKCGRCHKFFTPPSPPTQSPPSGVAANQQKGASIIGGNPK